MKILAYLTGGRPMQLVDRCLFVDVVTGYEVGVYRDFWGRGWLAENRFSLFRVRVKGYDK